MRVEVCTGTSQKKLALITVIGDVIELNLLQFLNFAVFVINELEQVDEGRAKVKTESATVADVKHAIQFFPKIFFQPVSWILWMQCH